MIDPSPNNNFSAQLLFLCFPRALLCFHLCCYLNLVFVAMFFGIWSADKTKPSELTLNTFIRQCCLNISEKSSVRFISFFLLFPWLTCFCLNDFLLLAFYVSEFWSTQGNRLYHYILQSNHCSDPHRESLSLSRVFYSVFWSTLGNRLYHCLMYPCIVFCYFLCCSNSSMSCSFFLYRVVQFCFVSRIFSLASRLTLYCTGVFV